MFSQVFAQDVLKGSLTNGVDIYSSHPDMRNFRICQKTDVHSIAPNLNISEDQYEFSPNVFRFAYSLHAPDDENALFTLECADLTNGHYINEKWISWPEEMSFRAVLWVHTKNPSVIGPAQAIVGKSTYKELKTLNWENHNVSDFSGCEKDKDLPTFICMGKRVWMEFKLPNSTSANRIEDISPEVLEQSVLNEISILVNEWSVQDLPTNIQVFLKENDRTK